MVPNDQTSGFAAHSSLKSLGISHATKQSHRTVSFVDFLITHIIASSIIEHRYDIAMYTSQWISISLSLLSSTVGQAPCVARKFTGTFPANFMMMMTMMMMMMMIEDLQWMEEFNRGGRIKPLLKIFNEWKSLTGVGELNPFWRSSMNGRV